MDSDTTAKALLSNGQLRSRVTIIPLNKVRYPGIMWPVLLKHYSSYAAEINLVASWHQHVLKAEGRHVRRHKFKPTNLISAPGAPLNPATWPKVLIKQQYPTTLSFSAHASVTV